MENFSRITVNIADGGLGRLPAGKDWYTGILFQNASIPTEYGTDTIKRIYSLKEAENLGITEDDYPVENYHISEYFRILSKNGKEGFLDVGFFDNLFEFDGQKILDMQTNANGELRQIGIWFHEDYTTDLDGICNTAAATLDANGTPTSIYLTANIADVTALADRRANNYKWVHVDVAQDGAGVGAALFVSQSKTIGSLGLTLGQTSVNAVHEFLGLGTRPVQGATEFQVPAFADGTLVKESTSTFVKRLASYGYTVIVPIQGLGSCFDVDAMTGASETSDFQEQSKNRVIGKIKRLSIVKLAPQRNRPLYVNPTTGQLTENTIQFFVSLLEEVLYALADAGEINTDENGKLPKNSITINPEQNVITNNKITISGKASPVGAATNIEFNLGYAVTIQ